jgi:hypothetical protein
MEIDFAPTQANHDASLLFDGLAVRACAFYCTSLASALAANFTGILITALSLILLPNSSGE